MSPVRVLIVDDSATMRGLITAMLRRDPEIEVIGTANDPIEARAAIKELNPDVLTLDIEMPNMNGLDFLEKIMRLRPMPVVMCSTLTQAGAEITVRALEIGAVDCVGKPSNSLAAAGGLGDLAEKVKAAAKARVRGGGERQPTPSGPPADYRPSNKVLAIGASTGGVEALSEVLSAFPENCPATVITQHMPPMFTRSFAQRLDKTCAPQIMEAEDGLPVQTGRVYIAPGGESHLEIVRAGGLKCRVRPGPPVSGHHPSVDVLFGSVAQVAGAAAVGVILTGMGKDGAAGLLAMRQAGARTLGQDESSSVIYGMPRVAHEMGGVERQAPLHRLGAMALDLCSAKAS